MPKKGKRVEHRFPFDRSSFSALLTKPQKSNKVIIEPSLVISSFGPASQLDLIFVGSVSRLSVSDVKFVEVRGEGENKNLPDMLLCRGPIPL